MSMINDYRLRAGLRWRSTKPTLSEAMEGVVSSTTFSAVALLLLIFVSYGIAGRMDYEDELRAAAERAQANEKRVLDCMNGQPLGYVERKKMSANDYGRTYIYCRPEELDV